MRTITTWQDIENAVNQLEVPCMFKDISTPSNPAHLKIMYFRSGRPKVDLMLESFPMGIAVDKIEVPDVLGSTREDLLRLTQ